MSVVPPTRCPACGGTDFAEFGRFEANEHGPGSPPEDVALYACACGNEFDSDDR